MMRRITQFYLLTIILVFITSYFSLSFSTPNQDDIKFEFNREIGAKAYRKDYGVSKSDCLRIGFNTVGGGLVDVTITLGDGKGIQWYNVSQGWEKTIFFINTSGLCEVIIARASATQDTVHVKGSVIIFIQGANRMAGGITYAVAAEPLQSIPDGNFFQQFAGFFVFFGFLFFVALFIIFFFKSRERVDQQKASNGHYWKIRTHKLNGGVYPTKSAREDQISFPAETHPYLTKQGHKVRSKSEQRIDNILTDLGIDHLYEPPTRLSGERILPDWYLPEYDAYIEYWGLEGQPEYDARTKRKLKLYAEHGKKVLSLEPRHFRSQKILETRIKQFLKKK